MIESTFWQAEKISDMEQGLWDEINCLRNSVKLDYETNSINWYALYFNSLYKKFEYPTELWLRDYGLTEHD